MMAPDKKMTRNEKKPAKKKLTEEEKEAIKIEEQNKLLRHQFERESKFTEFSNARGTGDHEKTCKTFTLERLTNELNATIQSLNRFLDRSDHTTAVIENHREHAEEQHQRLFAFHTQVIDCIFSLFNLFKNSVTGMYEDERDRLVVDFYDSSVIHERAHHERKTYYENYAHANVSFLKLRQKLFNEALTSRRVEIESWSVEHCDWLMDEKVRREKKACQEIKKILKLFTRKLWPKNRLEDYEKTKNREEQVNRECEKIRESITKSNEIIKALKVKADAAVYVKLLKIAELKSEYFYMQKLFSIFENKLIDEDKADKKRLQKLVVIAEHSKQKVLKLLEHVSRIHSASKICCKHEKLEDIFRYQSFESSHESFHHNDITSLFYFKLTQVEADCEVLRNYKNKLICENQNARRLIEHHEHQHALAHNYRLLNLDFSPNVGCVHNQVGHEAPQVKDELMKRKLLKQHMEFFEKHYHQK